MLRDEKKQQKCMANFYCTKESIEVVLTDCADTLFFNILINKIEGGTVLNWFYKIIEVS